MTRCDKPREPCSGPGAEEHIEQLQSTPMRVAVLTSVRAKSDCQTWSFSLGGSRRGGFTKKMALKLKDRFGCNLKIIRSDNDNIDLGQTILDCLAQR